MAAAKSQIAKSPNVSGFYDLLGTALFQKKDYSAADAAFHKAIDLDKNNSDALLKLGRHSLIVYWVHIEIVYGRWFWRDAFQYHRQVQCGSWLFCGL